MFIYIVSDSYDTETNMSVILYRIYKNNLSSQYEDVWEFSDYFNYQDIENLKFSDKFIPLRGWYEKGIIYINYGNFDMKNKSSLYKFINVEDNNEYNNEKNAEILKIYSEIKKVTYEKLQKIIKGEESIPKSITMQRKERKVKNAKDKKDRCDEKSERNGLYSHKDPMMQVLIKQLVKDGICKTACPKHRFNIYRILDESDISFTTKTLNISSTDSFCRWVGNSSRGWDYKTIYKCIKNGRITQENLEIACDHREAHPIEIIPELFKASTFEEFKNIIDNGWFMDKWTPFDSVIINKYEKEISIDFLKKDELYKWIVKNEILN